MRLRWKLREAVDWVGVVVLFLVGFLTGALLMAWSMVLEWPG